MQENAAASRQTLLRKEVKMAMMKIMRVVVIELVMWNLARVE